MVTQTFYLTFRFKLIKIENMINEELIINLGLIFLTLMLIYAIIILIKNIIQIIVKITK